MIGQFFECPILNSPYAYQAQHWEPDGDGQPTNRAPDSGQRCDFITPVPKPKKRRKSKDKTETARLLQHWWHHQFQGIRPLFCHVEAVETAIRFTEAAPKLGNRGTNFIGGISGGE